MKNEKLNFPTIKSGELSNFSKYLSFDISPKQSDFIENID